jgi:hypothetical protein
MFTLLDAELFLRDRAEMPMHIMDKAPLLVDDKAEGTVKTK